MIEKDIISYVSSKTKIENQILIEKDIILHLLLVELSRHRYFKKNFVFKGGTCLVKCCLGYYRFSEDLDFTFIPQAKFKEQSGK